MLAAAMRASVAFVDELPGKLETIACKARSKFSGGQVFDCLCVVVAHVPAPAHCDCRSHCARADNEDCDAG